MNDKTWESLGASLGNVLTLIVLFETSYILDLHNKMKPMQDAVAQCEKSLPRDQHCRIEYAAVPIKGDTQ